MSSSDAFDRPARESRPSFSPAEPIAERLVRMFTSLATELAVVRERLDTVEQLLEEQGQVTAADIDGFVPDADTEARRREWRDAYISRLFADLQAEINDASARVDSATGPKNPR